MIQYLRCNKFNLAFSTIFFFSVSTIWYIEHEYHIAGDHIQVFILYIMINMIYLLFLARGKPVDATQELLAIGLCNVGNSFFHGFPGTGSFSRSAVNAASGVRTPLGGLCSGENDI